jgi:hypothetical protein
MGAFGLKLELEPGVSCHTRLDTSKFFATSSVRADTARSLTLRQTYEAGVILRGVEDGAPAHYVSAEERATSPRKRRSRHLQAHSPLQA